MKSLIARMDAFTKTGKYVRRGQVIQENEVDYDSEDENSPFIEAPSGLNTEAVVEMSAIAPTGPNPQNPQQIPTGTYQTEAGYVQDGAKLVGEVTQPEKQRIAIVGLDKDDNTQAQVVETLEKADREQGNLPNEGTEGTVAEVSARVADMDEAGLAELEARENDREKPRVGVMSAIEARRAELAAS